MTVLKLPAHGGDLQWALEHFGGNAEDWLDLSTGISPWSWPVPAVPPSVWHRLPPVDAGDLCRAAADFYGCPAACVLPVPGSQFAIAHLPRLVRVGRVAIPDPGYSEHVAAWQAAGHQPVYYETQARLVELIATQQVQHAVVINPNNPTGEAIEPDRLREWHQRLGHRDGVLLVDEAFGDCRPAFSVARFLPADNVIVLRSLGKFFGLAGVRLGFLLASPVWKARLGALCQPWQVSGPAHWLGARALSDTQWQTFQRRRLRHASVQLQATVAAGVRDRLVDVPDAGRKIPVAAGDPAPSASALRLTGTDLFATLSGPAPVLYRLFVRAAEQRVLLRYGLAHSGDAWVRMGLPGVSADRFNARMVPVFLSMNCERIS